MRLRRSAASPLARLQARAELAHDALLLDLDRNGEAARPADARASGELGAPEAAPRREQRQGFEEIGLSRAVLAAKHDQRAFEREVEAGVGTKVPEHQPAHHRAAARAGKSDRLDMGRDVPRPAAARKGKREGGGDGLPGWTSCRICRSKNDREARSVAAFEVLMPAEGMTEISEAIEKRVALHRLWRAHDREATLEAIAPRIRAIVATWHSTRIDAALMRRLPNLEIVVSFGVGYDHVDAAWAGAHGIIVTNTPGVLDEDTADIAMALTLAAVRRLPQAERYLRAGRWQARPFRSPLRCADAPWEFSDSGESASRSPSAL